MSSDRIGEKLRILREQKGLTTRQLGETLGISHVHVVRIENGKKGPSIDLLAKISRYFDVPADVLIKDELELGD
jgi:transcriptional regulator with XRE-family HTH domain